MLSVDQIKVESDERGFELHILDDEGDWHVFNIHSVALEFYDDVRDKIGEWAAEGRRAQAEVAAGVAGELLERDPGESAQDYYERTGNAEPLREAGDIARKAERENPSMTREPWIAGPPLLADVSRAVSRSDLDWLMGMEELSP